MLSAKLPLRKLVRRSIVSGVACGLCSGIAVHPLVASDIYSADAGEEFQLAFRPGAKKKESESYSSDAAPAPAMPAVYDEVEDDNEPEEDPLADAVPDSDDMYEDVPFLVAPAPAAPSNGTPPKAVSASNAQAPSGNNAASSGIITPDILQQQIDDQGAGDSDDPLFSEQIFLEEEAPAAKALEQATPSPEPVPQADPLPETAPVVVQPVIPSPPKQEMAPVDVVEPALPDLPEPPVADAPPLPMPPAQGFSEDDGTDDYMLPDMPVLVDDSVPQDVPVNDALELAEPPAVPSYDTEEDLSPFIMEPEEPAAPPRFARPDEFQPDDDSVITEVVPDEIPAQAEPAARVEIDFAEPEQMPEQMPEESADELVDDTYEFTFPDNEPDNAARYQQDYSAETVAELPDPELVERNRKLDAMGPFDDQFRMPEPVAAPVAAAPVELAPTLMPVPVYKARLAPGSKQILDELPDGLSSVEEEVAKKPISIDRTSGMPSAFPPEGYSDSEPIGISISATAPEKGIDEILDTAYEALLFGQMEGAIALYRQVLDRDPGNRLGLFGLATAYQRNRQITQARYVYDRLFRLYPDYPEALNNFLVLISEEAPDEALVELEKLSRRNPKYSPIPAQMGMVYLQQSDFGQAAQYLARAVSLSPENITYRYNLAIVMDQLGESREAATLYQQVLKAGEAGAQLPTKPSEIQKRLTFLQSN